MTLCTSIPWAVLDDHDDDDARRHGDLHVHDLRHVHDHVHVHDQDQSLVQLLLHRYEN